jgi:hypothetical protein
MTLASCVVNSTPDAPITRAPMLRAKLSRSSPNGYRLYWGVYVRRVSWLTRPYLVAIEPFRCILYPAMLRRIRRAWLIAYAGMNPIDIA